MTKREQELLEMMMQLLAESTLSASDAEILEAAARRHPDPHAAADHMRQLIAARLRRAESAAPVAPSASVGARGGPSRWATPSRCVPT